MKNIKILFLTLVLVASAKLVKGQIICPTYTGCASYTCPAAPSCELIVNGSFECIGGDNSGYPTACWQIEKACGWTTDAYTPDYFNLNSLTADYDIPCNEYGSQSARSTPSGTNSYVGFVAWTQGSSHPESIRSLLKSTMVNGKNYLVSFWLSLADVCAQNTIGQVGVQFTSGGTSYSGVFSPTVIAEGSVSSTVWTQFTYTYTAYGTEDGIRIGAIGSGSLNSTITNTNNFAYCTTSVTASAPYYFLDDISVTEIIPLTASFSPTTSCIGEPVTLTASGANTYTWNPGNLTGSSVVVTPTATTVYTVTGTSSAGCYVSQQTITVTPAACCVNTNTNNINFHSVNLVPNGTHGAIPYSSLTPGYFYSGNIAIPASGIITSTLTIIGSFSISTPVTFSLCNMSILEDVAIYQNSTTTIDRSWLYGCNKLWLGILSRANLVVTNSYIEDAFMAINAGFFMGLVSHPGITVDNVVFNKNYYGITAGTCSMTPGNFKVTGSIFTCRRILAANHDFTPGIRYTSFYPNFSALLPQTILGSTAQGITAGTKRSNYGIWTNNLLTNNASNFRIADVSTTATLNATYTNEFDYVNVGIYNQNSKVEIYNNKFSNIATVSTGTALGAIYHDDAGGNANNTITKIGSSSGSPTLTVFYKNVFGWGTSTILDGVTAVNGGNLEVSSNDFYNISRYGVNVKSWYAITPANEPVLVSTNSFSTCAYAFYAYDNNSIKANITANTLVQPATTYTNYYNVYINEINKPAGTSYSVNANNFAGSLYGVYIINTKNSRVVNNIVQVGKPTSTSIYNAPVWLDNSDLTTVKGNTLTCNPTNSGSWNTYGLFGNASATLTVKCNVISKVSACLKFQSNCSSTGIYFNSLNNTGGADPCLYGVWLDNGGQTGNIGYYSGTQWQMSDDIWGDFNYAAGGADTKCQNSSNYPTQGKIYYDPAKAAVNQASVNLNTFGGTDFSQSFVPTSTTTTNSQNCGETARLMAPGSGGGKNTAPSDNPSLANDLKDEFVNTQDRKRIFLPTTSSSNNKVIKGANEEGFYLVDSLIELYTSKKDSNALASAKIANAAINAGNNQEQNQKDFNSIYCLYLQNDSLVTTNQIQSLKNLALLCPFTEGLAVYEARGLMRNWDDSTMYFNVCENNPPDLGSSNRLGSSNNSVGLGSEVITQVFPNPNNGNLTVNCNCKDCIFEVYDLIGKKVMSQKLNENETKVDLTSLNNGTYLYKITNNGCVVKTDKLILNK